MARKKKDGRRKPGSGIQGKGGSLYILVSQYVIENGIRIRKRKWIPTRLPDKPENIKLAMEMRDKLLHNGNPTLVETNISLADYIDTVLEAKKREISDTTYANYSYQAKRTKKHFGNIKIRDIHKEDIEAFLDSLLEKDGIQPRTAKDTKAFLSLVMELAVKDGIISHNPVKEVVLSKKLIEKYKKDKPSDEEFLSYEEAKLFLERSKDHELYELFYFTLFFGLRREEVLGIRWSAVNLKDRTMAINHTVRIGTSITRSNTTKTDASHRVYPLNDEQIEVFKRLKEQEKENRKLFGKQYLDNDYVFKHADGTLYYPDYPSKAFRKQIKKIPELPQSITFHGLRKSCVSILFHEGMDAKSIQKWVGHADINTTLQIYAKVKEKEAKKEISDAMSGLISHKDE